MTEGRSSTFLNAPALSDDLAPEVRVKIADALGAAMRGETSAAMSALNDSTCDKSKADPVGRAVARALILHWDLQGAEALEVLDNVALRSLSDLPEEVRMILEQDRADAAFARGWPIGDDLEQHYGQVDRRRLAGVTFGDADALLEAAKASEAGMLAVRSAACDRDWA